jgi:hypothetical protein
MKIGRRIFFELATGNVILDKGEMQGSVVPTTIAQDIQNFTILSSRNRDSYDSIELGFGEFGQDFAACNGYRVNPETRSLEFTYPDPTAPIEPLTFQKPLTAQIDELKRENSDLTLQMIDLFEQLLDKGVL